MLRIQDRGGVKSAGSLTRCLVRERFFRQNSCQNEKNLPKHTGFDLFLLMVLSLPLMLLRGLTLLAGPVRLTGLRSPIRLGLLRFGVHNVEHSFPLIDTIISQTDSPRGCLNSHPNHESPALFVRSCRELQRGRQDHCLQ